jgi:iron-sulfur cluster assembly accessory protein
MLQLTDRAVEKVKQLMRAENKGDHALRVAVKGGGCSGFQYELSYESRQGDNDHVLEFHGLKVLVDAMSKLYLDEPDRVGIQDPQPEGHGHVRLRG